MRWQQQMPNLHLLRQTIEKQIATTPADIIVLPEVFNGVHCDMDPSAGPQARQFLATLAKATNAAIVGGSIDYQHSDAQRRNTCWVVNRQGEEVGAYHKRVLFAAEQADRRPGNEAGIFDLEGIRVAVLICGDLWEPAMARELVGRADLLAVPAKTAVPSQSRIDYARKLWWNLALTRAMENGLPVVVADWAEGRHESIGLVGGTRTRSVHYTSGGASITDPGKRPDFDALQTKLSAGRPGLLAANIDLDAVRAYQEYRQSVGLLPPPGTA
ncbi:MAG TPA: carbon-nitrogen hydrolase family protein [Phycisphaerae bacterium]|nr:carbon-nitrogen hydrolase family protein [Phycisphaerae bacterium]HOJ55414.1 carbon-nitrogen hydrolase family protein [Phycisphaerae bacterium]HOL24962.1 carbon-nitrogen hydrolase family protein [Phycisphaerae bacterium]HPP20064.1 carbon-nitrogen hydrolase family protein [Phycisphaerae bacterium]HPU32427.1 carbon-nitrogen hydrolase family protein [Phycisphaerae bacterium]